MKKIINKTTLLALISLLATATIVVSCKKDKNENIIGNNIQLLSFGPAGVQHGEEIRFFGNNLDKVTAIEFAGNGAVVDKSSFVSQTAREIKLIVPQAAERGRVTLKTPQGDIVSKAMFDLGVGATVASVSTEARPGATITIKGSFLNWVTAVTFAKDKSVMEFVSQSFDELVVTVPEDAQTGPLVIAYSGTEAGNFETDEILTVTLPVGTAITPAAVKHGDNITITGTDLDLVRKVYFNNVATAVEEFVSQSATELVVAVPGGTTKGIIKLEAASGLQTESEVELDVILPVATSIAPSAVKHAENITITGTNLDLTAKVIFTGAGTTSVTEFVSKTATQLVVKVPAGATSGKVTLEVASGVATVSEAEVKLTIPVITTLAPNPVGVGSNLTITGTNLDLATSVVFENVSTPVVKANFVSQSATQIVVKVPAGIANGKVRLGIQNATVLAESADILEISGAAPPPTIAYYFYDDDGKNGFGKWGGFGGGAVTWNNSTPIRIGNYSAKCDFAGGWSSAFQMGGSDVQMSSYTSFKFSIYPTADAEGKQVQVVLKGTAGSTTAVYTIPEAGKWHDVSIPFTSFSGDAITNVTEFFYQDRGNAYTIYLDEVGLY